MKLTKDQELASLHFKGPALVLAVPGAGKTTVLLKRIENLIKIHNLNPKKILSITFSKAQADDMKARYESNPNNLRGPHFSTIHSFAYQILRAYMKENKLNLNLIEGSGDYNKYSLIRRLYYSINSSFIWEDELEEFFQVYGFIKNTMSEKDEYLRTNKVGIKNFDKLFDHYEAYKKEKFFIDFEDMLALALKILNDDEKILIRVRQAFSFVQVDEAQDNSKVQSEIIKKLVLPENNLFMVADDDQSIYSFRGSQPQELLNFRNIYKDGKVFFMEDNFRSSKDIVSLANSFIQSNQVRYKKTIKASKEKENPILIVKARDLGEQAKYLSKKIQEDKNNETAILYRNNVSALALMSTFIGDGIEFYNKDRKRTYLSHFVVEDILNIIKLSEDMTDPKLYESVYYKLNSYLKKSYLNYAYQTGVNESVFDAILESPDLKDFQVNRILELKDSFLALKKMDMDKKIHFIDKVIGYGVYLSERTSKLGSAGQNADMVLESLKFISKGLKTSKDLEEKLKYIKNHKTENSESSVYLSTIHSSKGLEFDSVYLIDLVDGEFPSDYSKELAPTGQKEALEEERRLFYVGMTRAKSKLTLVSPKKRNGLKVRPSRFFTDVIKIGSKS